MTLPGRSRTTFGSTLAAAAAALVLVGCALLGNASPARASGNQLAMLEVPGLQNSDPSSTLTSLRSLGVNIARVEVIWSQIAPNANSRHRPAGFNASNPGSYPPAKWAPLDQLVNQAQADGIALDFVVMGGAPLWATSRGAPGCTQTPHTTLCYTSVWKPSATEYGKFVHAIGTRYGGVHFWEIWNEINWGPSLAPQGSGSTIVGAHAYRALLGAGWSALQSTNHGRDTILDGDLSQDGSQHLTAVATSAPLPFIRALYCVDSSYHKLRGSAARAVGCPTTTGGSRRFRARNPALFKASGFGVHPYPYGSPPTTADFPSKDGVEFSEIPQLTRTLDRAQHAYGSNKQLSAFNTEYGYQTRPPATQSYFPSPATAAEYLNEAEYLSWKNPRIASYDNYELMDGGWFNTGLLTTSGQPKDTFYAYRLPVWLPSTSQSSGGSLEVWGDARPAHYAQLDTGQSQTVSVQFSPGSTGAFSTIATAPISDSRGYFDVHVRFPSSGQVRLAWQYPAGDPKLYNGADSSQSWIYSRVIDVTVQ
jgi:hypothetical protein